MTQEQRELLTQAFGELPTKEGYELVGVEKRTPKCGDLFYTVNWNTLSVAADKMGTYPTAIFKKLKSTPPPTTIHDLAPNGNETVFIHSEADESWVAFPRTTTDGAIMLGGFPISQRADSKQRWSHSIHTPYSEANEFVG